VTQDSQSRGGDLFIVDNSDSDWKVQRYLRDWTDIAHSFDIATGYFEIGALLGLDGQWQKLSKMRVLMGDTVSKSTKKALLDGISQILDRSIEQPVYKRRWDEQWKVGNRWQCGPVAYDAEFVDAFDWWLSEKAEWWLEKKKNGGPVALDEWTAALQQDPRVQAAWGVALVRLGKRADFDRYFVALVKEQTVPDDIPAAVPWDELEKKRKIPAAVKRIRGKLNVPRERFRVTASGGYVWAGVK
jgi:hypothetical protein